MRVIAGKFGSRRLKSLEGANTRPTQDKIKEAIFSKVGPYFDGGQVLDLFGGSGAFGIECLSRGMDYCVYADNNYQAIKIIKTNLEDLDISKQAKVIKGSYQKALELCNQEKFKVIFLDPPYALKVHDEIIKYVVDHGMLVDDGILIVETDTKTSLIESYQTLKLINDKEYGKTKISYYKKVS